MNADLDRAARAALTAARMNAGMSQRTLARQLGRAHSYIGKLETGTRKTTLSDFVLIAQAAGANPVDLLARVVRRDSAGACSQLATHD